MTLCRASIQFEAIAQTHNALEAPPAITGTTDNMRGASVQALSEAREGGCGGPDGCRVVAPPLGFTMDGSTQQNPYTTTNICVKLRTLARVARTRFTQAGDSSA